MCCFSGSVERVKNTSILVRRCGGRQLVVYEMKVTTSEPVAMILPLHVAPGSGEDALRFLDLGMHTEFFDQLDSTFEQLRALSLPAAGQREAALAPLRVQAVGAFDASYVPRLADFARLDPRFRIDDSVWAQLPGYRDVGFAVFQLRAGDLRVHPMAFDYPARWPARLCFPTVHVHDGALPARAQFDHSLYFQGFTRVDIGSHVIGATGGAGGAHGMYGQWSDQRAGAGVHGPLAARLVDLDARVFRLTLRGLRRNDDIWVVPDMREPSLARTDRGVSAWSPVE